jgi:DNA-binding MarR family transcriptional regulator
MMTTFPGFTGPEQNWSKLPHEFIDALPLVETIGEMKIILYVLRHTWGYHDEEKRITLDEFQNGRKRRDGSRIDNGTGLSKPTVIDGIERAIKHGFLQVEIDERDKARVKKFYSLTASDVKKLDSNSQDSLQRSEKDTQERNLEEKTPDGDSLF